MPWGVAAAAVGGLIAADGAKSGANAQAGASREASAQEREMFDISRKDQEPWRVQGTAGLNRLAYLLGVSPGGAGSANAPTRDQLRAELLSQFTTTPAGPAASGRMMSLEGSPEWVSASDPRYSPDGTPSAPSIDEAGLNAAIEARLAQQAQAGRAAQTAAQGDPAYGSLLRDFSSDDMNADPVYQSGLKFGLEEGTKGINRLASASGGRESGALLKALTRFGNDYASTKGNESFNRFNTNKGNQFNRLAGLAGVGQTSVAQTGNQAVHTGASIGQNTLIGGMARGAGAIGQASALGNTMNSIYGIGKKNNWWDGLTGGFTPNAGGTDPSRYSGFDAAANGGWGIE